MATHAPMSSNDPNLLENVCLVRFAYHLWRLDTAARALPTDPDIPEFEMMKDRWEIGLVLELVCHIPTTDSNYLSLSSRKICVGTLQMHA